LPEPFAGLCHWRHASRAISSVQRQTRSNRVSSGVGSNSDKASDKGGFNAGFMTLIQSKALGLVDIPYCQKCSVPKENTAFMFSEINRAQYRWIMLVFNTNSTPLKRDILDFWYLVFCIAKKDRFLIPHA
jgi:hypothetical protein